MDFGREAWGLPGFLLKGGKTNKMAKYPLLFSTNMSLYELLTNQWKNCLVLLVF